MKVLSITIGFILFLGAGVALEMRSIVSDLLLGELDKQGVSLASDLAARSADLVLTSNVYAMHQLLHDTVNNNDSVQYAFVTNEKNEVVAHTFSGGFPVALLRVAQEVPAMNQGKRLLEIEEQVVHDFSRPIVDGRVGVARVGLHEKNIRASIIHVTRTIVQTTIMMSIVGIFAAFLLTNLLHYPINLLVDATRRVSLGDFAQRVVIHTKDQIGILARAFNEMGENLARKEGENSRLLAELEKKESVRRNLLKTLITAQESERKRISRELHDETGQMLSSLMLHLRHLKSAEGNVLIDEEIERMRAVVEHSIHEVKRISRQLRPSILDDMGLLPAVEHLGREYQKNAQFEVDVVIQGREISRRLLPELEITLFRIVQEALTNVTKYAEASNVSIIFTLRGDLLQLIIEDDGEGFDVERHFAGDTSHEHLGLHGMQERVEIVGGTFQIESTRGVGTTIYVSIPITYEESEALA
ncbi:HAMP domain-containing sensor histidine kinase [Chrysiogenes arsenatis]|uniref:HAMP domain-containing sensor histidine kinase n=1 Tax=Chrysiogenes arsenatis TaxID=309797 RepID=UPI001F37A9CB|nr:sensor histidine kinase [Chrysiogenes arsenatis]